MHLHCRVMHAAGGDRARRHLGLTGSYGCRPHVAVQASPMAGENDPVQPQHRHHETRVAARGPRLSRLTHLDADGYVTLRPPPSSSSPDAPGSKGSSTEPLDPLLMDLLAAQIPREHDAKEWAQAPRYLVDPPAVSPRVDQQLWAPRISRVLAKWEPRVTADGWTAERSHHDYANDDRHLVYNVRETRFLLIESGPWPPPVSKSTSKLSYVISSPLLLYRVCCLFGGIHIKVEGRDGYKVMWSAEVRHVATGEALGFSEWKGAALVRVSNLQAPAAFEADMLELLNLLCDPQFPTPYDGCVAGSLA